ncbi:glutathione S-transferase T3-like [Hordeum vulgare subsp. vulgare]|uniref:glutathione S-transferase T3-like n=1 Tax=Hordeum vulgare subsp. vulgare TaxID=112509 RepID=UPI001D1A43D0|nr:glutathione S-transferase T3-like [Hordeum vulgare subsp. vulgare]
MGQQSKRTRAPVPRLVLAVLPHLVQPPPPHLVQPPPHLLVQPPPHLVQAPMPPHEPESGGSIPPRPPKAATSSVSSWSPQMQAPLWYTNLDDLNAETWGVDSHPPGGFLGFFKDASNVNSSQQIKEKDDSNGVECARTEKRLLWTKDEDLRLVGAWLNNSNGPIQSNYKKNDQYWKEVAAVYNSTTPKNRERLVKQVKDRFARIKKRVAWFCGSYKEANALYASGESDTDLKKRAMQTYEADHKEDGPFMFERCWEVLKD